MKSTIQHAIAAIVFTAAFIPDNSLADMKVSAKGEIQDAITMEDGKQKKISILTIVVTALDGVAADVYAVGPVTANSLSLGGSTVKPKDSIKLDGFDVIDRSPGALRKAFSVEHPKNGISAEIDFVDVPMDTKSTGPLKGVIKVLAGGTEKSITIPKPHTESPGLIDDPALKAAGLEVKFTRQDQGDFISVGVELSPKSANAYVAIELLSADGLKMGGGHGSRIEVSGRASHYKLIEKNLLETATLKFRFREGAKEVDIPFEFPDVEVSK